MANNISKSISKAFKAPSGGNLGILYQLTCSFDTANTELELQAANAAKNWYVVGILMGITENHGVTFYSGNTAVVTWDVNTEGQILSSAANGLLAMTAVNESLGASLDTVASGTVTFLVTNSDLLAAFYLGLPR